MHVNADDVEAVIHAVLFALNYRMKFKRDVFIDLLGYRKYGHKKEMSPDSPNPSFIKIFLSIKIVEIFTQQNY